MSWAEDDTNAAIDSALRRAVATDYLDVDEGSAAVAAVAIVAAAYDGDVAPPIAKLHTEAHRHVLYWPTHITSSSICSSSLARDAAGTSLVVFFESTTERVPLSLTALRAEDRSSPPCNARQNRVRSSVVVIRLPAAPPQLILNRVTSTDGFPAENEW